MKTEIDDLIEDSEAYRDSLATIDAQGKRIWLYPRKPSGAWFNARTWATVVYLCIFLVLPFIKYQGDPILLFDVLNQKFILFGILFTPPDFYILAISMVTFIIFIALFTAIFGRLFCGWACPQTIFMEMIFRQIEYRIEGDSAAQRRLNASEWNSDKFTKKAIKHFIFFTIAVIVANYFLAYIIGMDQVIQIIKEPVSQNIGGFIAMLGFSGIFYGVFAFMREQVCTQICPYGRMQSVLLNNDSIVVAYDFVRGEPREKLHKPSPLTKIQESVTKAAGHCIDCSLCVQVCPTGIDIRNGTQLECTNCTACIDVCNTVMEKIGKPRNLIRYDSLNGVKSGKRNLFNNRAKAYSVLLSCLSVLSIWLIATRSQVDCTIFRTPGQTWQVRGVDLYSNLYTFQVFNKTRTEKSIQLRLVSPAQGKIVPVGGSSVLQTGSLKKAEGAFFVELAKGDMPTRKTKVVIEVRSNNEVLEYIETNFIGPF